MTPDRKDFAALPSGGDDDLDDLSDEERDLIVRYMVMRALAQLGLGEEPSSLEPRWKDDDAETRTYRRG